ncbi:MAG: hypothetical protein KFF77_01690 [Bacteroidetes bacterium]|nr:hypothetical protein [Bacteroidota bacterium]
MTTKRNHRLPQNEPNGGAPPRRRKRKGRRGHALSLELTLFLDGRLDAADSERVAMSIEQDEDVRNEYESLQRLRVLLASRPPIPADPWLPERITNRIREEEKRDPGLLAGTRRLGPLPVTAVAVLAVAILVFAWIQRNDIYRYVSDTGSEMQYAYEETIVKGWIMPLFERTNRDQVLEFAMFGTLPLDMEDGTLLRVDKNTDEGYRFELASSAAPLRPAATVDELYQEIRPTEAQRKVFDTLFHYAQRQLESAVLVNEGREIAVNPSIGRFNTVILSGIASNLEPEQLLRFERFLDERKAPYTLASRRDSRDLSPPPPPQQVLDHIRTVRSGNDFVVFDNNSYSVVRISLDMDSLRRLMGHSERLPRFEFRVQELARSYASRVGDELPPPLPPKGVRINPVTVQNGGEAISISIDVESGFMDGIEKEFQKLRQQIVVLRRESEELRDREFIRIEEELGRNLQFPVRKAPAGRRLRVAPDVPEVSITMEADSIRIVHMNIDTTLLLPDGIERELRFEMRELLKNLRIPAPTPSIPNDSVRDI